MVWRTGSSAATAARAATVLPAPTSPVTTPMARSLISQAMRATASAWPRWGGASRGPGRGRRGCGRSRSGRAAVRSRRILHGVGGLDVGEGRRGGAASCLVACRIRRDGGGRVHPDAQRLDLGGVAGTGVGGGGMILGGGWRVGGGQGGVGDPLAL